MRKLMLSLAFAVGMSAAAQAQPPRPHNIEPAKLAPGDAGIAWYTTWATGLAEAKRSGRPILFMAAATQCNGVSGVF